MDKESSFDIIRRHCYEDNSIPLSHKQKELLDRWNMVIELRTCESLKTKDIIQRLLESFPIERATAFNDVSYAEALFGYNITINKRYRIAARIDFLEEYIADLKTANEHKAAAMQEANLIRWYEQYPDLKKPEQPRKFIFQYNPPPDADLLSIEDAEHILIEADKNG